MIFKLRYNQIYQLKTTIIILHFFFQNLLGLRAKTWKLLMNATSDLNEDWLRYKRDEIGHAQLYHLDMNAFFNSLVTQPNRTLFFSHTCLHVR